MKKRTGKILALLLSLTMVAGAMARLWFRKRLTVQVVHRQRQQPVQIQLVRKHLSLEIPPSMQKMRNPTLIRTAHTADGHVYVMALEKL